MALELNGTTGVSLVQDGVVTAADLSSTLDLSSKTMTLPPKYATVQETAETGLSGVASVEYTDIPSYVTRITLIGSGVSHSTSGHPIQIKVGDSTTNGYPTGTHTFHESYVTDSGSSYAGLSASQNSWRFGSFSNPSHSFEFICNIVSLGANNKWYFDLHGYSSSYTQYHVFLSGHVTLSGTLDRISLFTTSGTLDSGSTNIIYS